MEKSGLEIFLPSDFSLSTHFDIKWEPKVIRGTFSQKQSLRYSEKVRKP